MVKYEIEWVALEFFPCTTGTFCWQDQIGPEGRECMSSGGSGVVWKIRDDTNPFCGFKYHMKFP